MTINLKFTEFNPTANQNRGVNRGVASYCVLITIIISMHYTNSVISNLENDQINQVKVSDTDAIKGTYTPLPDGRVAWFCRYGQVVAGMSGELATPNKGIYAPEFKEAGAAGYLEHNGRQLIVNSLDKNSHANNDLAIGDYWEIEIDGEVCTC